MCWVWFCAKLSQPKPYEGRYRFQRGGRQLCLNPKQTNARCAECGSVSVVPPNAAARVGPVSMAHASASRCMGASAQHARAADGPRSKRFSNVWYAVAVPFTNVVAAAANGQPVGWHYLRSIVKSRRAISQYNSSYKRLRPFTEQHHSIDVLRFCFLSRTNAIAAHPRFI